MLELPVAQQLSIGIPGRRINRRVLDRGDSLFVQSLDAM